MKKATSNSRFKLIAKDPISWLQLTFLEGSEVIFALGSGGGVVRQTSLLAELASGTLGMISDLGAQ